MSQPISIRPPLERGPSHPQLSLVIPLFNEAAGVQDVVHSLLGRLHSAQLSFQLILVDNGSTDGTWQLIQEIMGEVPTIECIKLPRNAGYGGGILAGMDQARGNIRGYLWGDEQIGHHAVIQCFEKLQLEALDLCKVRRTVRLDGFERLLVTRLYHGIAPLFLPVKSTDIHGCPKLFTKRAWRKLQPTATDWFLDAEIMSKASRLNMRIGEVDVVAYPRETGRSKVKWATLAEFVVNLGLRRHQ